VVPALTTPLLIVGLFTTRLCYEEKFRKKFKHQTGISWRMDETYIKVKGTWNYLYRAVDKDGDTINSMLSPKPGEAASKALFTKSIGSSGIREKVTIDKSGANLAGLNASNFQITILTLLGFSVMQIKIRQIKNQISEQYY